MLNIFLIGFVIALIDETETRTDILSVQAGTNRPRRATFDNLPVLYIVEGSGEGKPTPKVNTNRRKIQLTPSQIAEKQVGASEALLKSFQDAAKLHEEVLKEWAVHEHRTLPDKISNPKKELSPALQLRQHNEAVRLDPLKKKIQNKQLVEKQKTKRSFLDTLREHRKLKNPRVFRSECSTAS
jgi:hypothetical protein